MGCCKETRYNLLLSRDDFEKRDLIIENLKVIMNWSHTNAQSAYDHAQMTGQFTLSHGTSEKMTRLSLRLAEKSIPHKLILSKK